MSAANIAHAACPARLAHVAHLADARKGPRILSASYLARLAEANAALRQLRALGCRVLSVSIGRPNEASEILIDKNPHRRLAGCPGVHVSVAHPRDLPAAPAK